MYEDGKVARPTMVMRDVMFMQGLPENTLTLAYRNAGCRFVHQPLRETSNNHC